MGFAVYRIDEEGNETPLPSHAVFKGYTIQPGQTMAESPVQKFYWKDPYARPIAEKTGKRTFKYKVVPLAGKPGSLKPLAGYNPLETNSVEISSSVGPNIQAFWPFTMRSTCPPLRLKASRMRSARSENFGGQRATAQAVCDARHERSVVNVPQKT